MPGDAGHGRRNLYLPLDNEPVGIMRYRIGENPVAETLTLDQGAFLTIAALSLVIGIAFIVAGRHSKHYWMAIWGTGLALSSLGYIILVIARL
jgi:hypothetical protein